MQHEHEAATRLSAETLFRAHAGFIAAFLHRFGAPAHDIDDMVQEVFIIAHRKGGYVTGPAHPRTWLASIAVHVAQSARRALRHRERKIKHASDAALERAVTAVDPHQQLETRRALSRLQRALESLPAVHRAAFILHELEGEPCESIAVQYRVPIGTVYSRLHTARQHVLSTYERKPDTRTPRSVPEQPSTRAYGQSLALRWQ